MKAVKNKHIAVVSKKKWRGLGPPTSSCTAHANLTVKEDNKKNKLN